jgi:CubicO group peptidase (beta-lactamase class C family)
LRAWLGQAGLFEPGLVRRFWTRSQLPGSSRALGFDTPAQQLSQAGARMGPRTVGHLGYTGTSVWIDPDRELIAVLLSNRVHPTRDNERIKQFRPDLHDALVAAFDRECR